jgi:hypothetical protein
VPTGRARGSRAQPLGDELQHAIAEAAIERVVNGLKLSRSTNSSAGVGAAPARARARRGAPESCGDGQLRERVVVREAMQLAGALGHVAPGFRLRGQLRLGMLDAVGHGIEGFGQLGDFAEPLRGRARRGPRR